MTGVFDRGTGHEQVTYFNDPASGLRAIIAIYSTALGPALGGTRFYPYATEDDALSDVLNLSRAMAYKAACAGLDLGGGKAVIIGDPATDKTEALLRAYGRFVQSLGGRYYTACDVGTYVEDMDVVAASRRSSPAARRRTAVPATPRSSRRTASSRACGRRPRSPGAPRRCAAGGSASPASARSATTSSSTCSTTARRWSSPTSTRPPSTGSAQLHPEVDVLDVDALPTSAMDVYAPCALGGALSDEVVAALQARVVCGAANNQLAHPGHREAAGGARRPLRARLRRQLRRADPGGGRDRGLLRAPSAGEGAPGSTTRRCGSSGSPPTRACRRRSPPTGWPSGGWPRSGGCVGSGLRADSSR